MLALRLSSKAADLSQVRVKVKFSPLQLSVKILQIAPEFKWNFPKHVPSAKIFYVVSAEEIKTSASTYVEI